MTTTYQVPNETLEDDTKLIRFAIDKFGDKFKDATIETTWKSYDLDIIPQDTKDRLIVFKAPQSKELFGFLTVKDKEDKRKRLWDLHEKNGAHMGEVPAGCLSEAMTVDVRFIVPK